MNPVPDRVDDLLHCAHERIERRLAHVAACEPILRALPPDIADAATIGDDWLQISSLTHKQTIRAIRAMAPLHAGRWRRKPCHCDPSLVDYQAEVRGVLVIIFASGPPGSCRIIEETVELPAQTITRRRVVCGKEAA